MSEAKGIFQSRTIWGALVAIVASALRAADIDIGPAEQAALVDALISLAGCAGGLYAVYGRIKAKTVIKSKREKETK